MPIYSSDGEVFKSEAEMVTKVYGTLNSKQFSDLQEISDNQKSGDFNSRFGAIEGRTAGSLAGATGVQALKNNASTGSVDGSAALLDMGPPLIPDGGEFSPGSETGNKLAKNFGPWGVKQVQKAWEALKLPGDVMTGKASPNDIEKVTTLAGLMVMGPAPVASAMADGTLGSFIGVRSNTFDRKKLYNAQELEAAGTHPDDIWTKTGTFRGTDGRWRQEISDKEAKFFDVNDLRPGDESPLSAIYQHPELFKAYPWLKDTEIRISKDPAVIGMYHPGENAITLGAKPDKKTLQHEIQHAIQEREGFARGGDTKEFPVPLLEEAIREVSEFRYQKLMKAKSGEKLSEAEIKRMEALSNLESLAEQVAYNQQYGIYKTIMGEVEARNVETRSEWGSAERKTPPIWSEDIPRSQQINPNGTGDGQASAPKLTEAAIKVDDKVYTGKIHADAYSKAAEKHNDLKLNKAEEGFITSDGSFVTRKEASSIANNSGQMDNLYGVKSGESLGVENLKDMQMSAPVPIIRPYRQSEFDAALRDIKEGNDVTKHQAEQILRGMAKDLLGNRDYQILHGLGKDLGMDKPKTKK